MVWPARSLDLNPIEHVWDMLGRCIAGHSVPPGTLHELQQALLQEWALLPQQVINDTLASMHFSWRVSYPLFSMWFPLHILRSFCLSLLYCLICGLVMPHLPRVQLSRISI
ncbi:hypothetical protein AVEN_162967-1 [Araneus ventricosus]|uniref:Tc1-like transposase DDE domain-containing protein n=1 Tax=Araneus ventricosus TaxID=182803 RepID=A0A4Y2BZ44_ARAVE|nr:hypothetical protein AVEN_162967-1 [Araneus ventricosus]